MHGAPPRDAAPARPPAQRAPPSPEDEPLLLPAAPADPEAGGDARRPHVQFSNGADSGSSSSSSSGLAAPRPPDGGWGWVVVFASFMVNLIADGITFSFGVFYPHFLEYFGEGKGKTAWIAGIFMAMPLLSGPIASFLTDRYGCRRVTVCGALLASLGFLASAFVDNMETLFLTFGIMAGFGLSLCYVAAVVIVAYYFEARRSLATGISVCGSGIGTFVFAPLSYVLLDEYGWRGTTLIMSGLFLNMAVCGLLFRDLPWQAELNSERARERRRRRVRKRARRAGSEADSVAGAGAEAAPPHGPARPTFSSLVDLPTFLSRGELSADVLELMSSRGRALALLAAAGGGGGGGGMLPSRSFSDSGRLHEQSPRGALSPTSPLSPTGTGAPLSDKAAISLWLRRQQTGAGAAVAPGAARRAPGSFLKDVRVHRRSLTYRGAMLNLSRYRLRASSCPNIFRNSMTTIAKEKVQWYAGLWELWDLCCEILDLRHLADARFLLFAASNFLLYMWYDVPYVYLADRAVRLGLPESRASVLISVIGILNMFGELVLGWAGDVEGARPLALYAGCMVACGAACGAMPLLRAWPALAAAAGAFGAFISANYSLTSIILVDLITLERFTSAYGLLLLMQGVANLVGPPLAGWVYDITGSYDLSFYLAGVFIALSGVVLFVQPAAPPPPPPSPTAPPPHHPHLAEKHNGDLHNGKLLV